MISLCMHFFFFNDTPTTEIYTLSLHDALPILPLRPHGRDLRTLPRTRGRHRGPRCPVPRQLRRTARGGDGPSAQDRKSTRLNSSHMSISYAVFCLKKKKKVTK